MAVILEYSSETANFLKSQSDDPMTDGKVKLMLAHLNVTGVSRAEPAKDKAITHFSTALTAALND